MLESRRRASAEQNAGRNIHAQNAETILGPVNTGQSMNTACYSPYGKILATGGPSLDERGIIDWHCWQPTSIGVRVLECVVGRGPDV